MTSTLITPSGTLDIHKALEAKVAKFLHKDDAIIFGMGFATNSTNLPALLGKVSERALGLLSWLNMAFPNGECISMNASGNIVLKEHLMV